MGIVTIIYVRIQKIANNALTPEYIITPPPHEQLCNIICNGIAVASCLNKHLYHLVVDHLVIVGGIGTMSYPANRNKFFHLLKITQY